MPERYLRLAKPPAEVNLVAIHHGWKINQAGVGIFEFDAKILELLGAFHESFFLSLQFLLDGLEFLAIGFSQSAPLGFQEPVKAFLAFTKVLSEGGNVSHDGLNKRQGGVSLRWGEVFPAALRGFGRHGPASWVVDRCS